MALRTPLCELLGIQHPVVLAGMGNASRRDLVAAVSNAGGLGVIGGTLLKPHELREEIRAVREVVGPKPFGVDILWPAALSQAGGGTGLAQAIPPRYWSAVAQLREEFGLTLREPDTALVVERVEAQIDVIIEEQVPVFASGLGFPANHLQRLQAAGIKTMGIVGNVRHARRMAAMGVDLIVAQGTEAGGHTGPIGTMALVPQVVDAVQPIPVLAAGGIGDGRGLAAALTLGAVGAWVGTAFLVSRESYLDDVRKARVLEATEEDPRIIRVYTGKTMRGISNPFVDAWERTGLDPLPMPVQGYLISTIEQAALECRRTDLLMNPAGQIAGMLRESRPAAEILDRMVTEAERILRSLGPGMLEG